MLPPIISALIAVLVSLGRSSASLRLENLALRPQMALYQQTIPRPRRRPPDRLLWSWLARLWPGWQAALAFVQPRTVIVWQRRRFRHHWRRLSQKGKLGRPAIAKEVRDLIRDMSQANPTWGAPRIGGWPCVCAPFLGPTGALGAVQSRAHIAPAVFVAGPCRVPTARGPGNKPLSGLLAWQSYPERHGPGSPASSHRYAHGGGHCYALTGPWDHCALLGRTNHKQKQCDGIYGNDKGTPRGIGGPWFCGRGGVPVHRDVAEPMS